MGTNRCQRPSNERSKEEQKIAKLNKAKAKEVENTSDAFATLPAGHYHAVLMKVDTDKTGPAGPYWSWEFSVVDPEEFKSRKLWNNTTLAEGKMFGLKQTFDAFGVGTDADTDDLCGKIVKLQVGVRIIEQGQRKGEEANNINRVMAPDEEVASAFYAAAGGIDPDDVFGE